MKVLLCVLILVAFCQVCICRSVLQREKKIHERLEYMIKQLRGMIFDRPEKEKKHFVVKDKDDDEAKKNIEAIDNEDVDPNSEYLGIFGSFEVIRNGKKVKPNDLPFDKSPFVEGSKKESESLQNKTENELESDAEMLEEETKERSLSKRGFLTVRLWEKGIVPYIVDQSLNTTEFLSLLDQAINQYHNLTCIRWLPRSDSVQSNVGHQAYIKFVKSSGCNAHIGRETNAERYINMASGCLYVGSALHEMLHVLGRSHEQTRTDRDQHIYINETKFSGANYGKKRTRDYYPYDYESVMHYPFVDGVEPLQPELSFLASIGNKLSFYDVAAITRAYHCAVDCVNPPECKHGAFVNHRCKCYCPYGLTGETCDEVINANVCGGVIDLQPGDDVTITSPNYPQNYDVDNICVWLLRAPPNKHVRIHTDVLHLPYNKRDNRCYHWLEIRYNLMGQTGIRVCGDSNGDEWISSSWGEKYLMTLIFDSKFGKLHSPELGFSLRASVASDGCIPNPCVYGVCKDCGNQDFKCECDPGFEGRKCDLVQDAGTLTCTFEKGDNCFLKNVESDMFDWSVYTGSTPSNYTGPDRAYSGNNYMYAEASAPRAAGDKAVLQSDLMFPAQDRCFSFFYNMHGRGIGSLAVFSGNTQLWFKSGDQGYGWRRAEINVTSSTNLQIKIEAMRGNDWKGDIGIDEIKLSHGLCETGIERDCFIDSVGKDYKGKINYTIGGIPCQRWDSDTPHKHYIHEYDGEENYCRNMNGYKHAPWCYTTSDDKIWDFCDVPHCDIEMCSRSQNGYDYQGNKDVTVSGQKCKDNTKCRASGKIPKAWCYTVNPLVRWDACDVPKCSTPPKECRHTSKGIEYFGTVSVTASGKTCQRWDSQYPFSHSYWYLDDQKNYCRNPDNSARPWCYPADSNASGKEYCDIPYCKDLGCSSNPCLYGSVCKNTENNGHVCLCKPGYTGSNCGTKLSALNSEDCKRSAIGYEYKGQINTTISGRTCQKWALDTPHSHNHNDLPENFCRNPDGEPAPWCYTTSGKRWEICDVPFCTTPAKECLETVKGVNYFGTDRHTRKGIQCQRWSEQIPHSHTRYNDIDDQDDYCRNPYGHEPSPWCYTIDPNTRWDFCDIPSCFN